MYNYYNYFKYVRSKWGTVIYGANMYSYNLVEHYS